MDKQAQNGCTLNLEDNQEMPPSPTIAAVFPETGTGFPTGKAWEESNSKVFSQPFTSPWKKYRGGNLCAANPNRSTLLAIIQLVSGQ